MKMFACMGRKMASTTELQTSVTKTTAPKSVNKAQERPATTVMQTVGGGVALKKISRPIGLCAAIKSISANSQATERALYFCLYQVSRMATQVPGSKSK